MDKSIESNNSMLSPNFGIPCEVTEEEAERITFFAYEELLAFKRACEKLGLSKQDVEDVMYNNAAALVESARRSIYGA